MKRRKTIIESEKAKIEKVSSGEYVYWVYKTTPTEKVKQGLATIVFGGCEIWDSMFKTEAEAMQRYNEIVRG